MGMEFREAREGSSRTARRAARTAVFWAPFLMALIGGASPIWAANPAYLSIDVNFAGITNVANLTAVSGATAGTINLTWTEPFHSAGTPPFAYDVRVSSVAQIPNELAFIVS